MYRLLESGTEVGSLARITIHQIKPCSNLLANALKIVFKDASVIFMIAINKTNLEHYKENMHSLKRLLLYDSISNCERKPQFLEK